MKLKIEVETMSGLYIGGIPQGYSLGGVDMITATQNDVPYIPGSSFKGALREICRDHANDKIVAIYDKYLDKLPGVNKDEVIGTGIPMHLYVFGIQGINRSPKLVFSDLTLPNDFQKKMPMLFSRESKNTITEADGKIAANPRTYKVAASGLTFIGYAWSRGFADTQQAETVCNYIINMAKKFNNGEYRLGNSKSRGYGHVEVKITVENSESGSEAKD